jgi:hypothetical protein
MGTLEAPRQAHPARREIRRQGILQPQGFHRIEGFGELHGRSHIVLPFTVDNQVAVPADGVAAVFEGLPDLAQFAGCEHPVGWVARGVDLGRPARRRDSERGPPGGVALHLVRPLVATGAVEHVHGAFVAVHAHAVAIASTQQRGRGLVQQLAGQIPERDLDGADGAQQHVGGAVDAVAQPVVERFDFERVLAQKVRAQLQHARPDADAGAAVALADSVDAGVRHDFDKSISARALQDHRADVGDARAAALGRSQSFEAGQRCGGRECAQEPAPRKRKHRMPHSIRRRNRTTRCGLQLTADGARRAMLGGGTLHSGDGVSCCSLGPARLTAADSLGTSRDFTGSIFSNAIFRPTQQLHHRVRSPIWNHVPEGAGLIDQTRPKMPHEGEYRSRRTRRAIVRTRLSSEPKSENLLMFIRSRFFSAIVLSRAVMFTLDNSLAIPRAPGTSIASPCGRKRYAGSHSRQIEYWLCFRRCRLWDLT